MKLITDKIDAFSGLTHVAYLQDVLLPKVQNYSDTIDDFTNKLEQVKLIIRQFDENLTLKANKPELISFKT